MILRFKQSIAALLLLLVALPQSVLALDAGGRLLLIKAKTKEFELIDNVEISGESTWAHLAVSGDELFIRELGAVTGYRWSHTASK